MHQKSRSLGWGGGPHVACQIRKKGLFRLFLSLINPNVPWRVFLNVACHYNGALDGGSRCRMSILRNDNVACLCRLFMPMSHVEFKK